MTAETISVENRYLTTCEILKNHAIKHGRENESVKLVAVSKRHSADKIISLAKLGHQDFAENYLQEAMEKIPAVKLSMQQSAIGDSTIWHFIGHIQSRKCRQIAQYFDWVHTVESLKVANRLNEARADSEPLNVLIQLNLQQEESKSGIAPEQLSELATGISRLQNLKLRGLMIIPKAETDFDAQCVIFRQCNHYLKQLNSEGFNLDQLSMGMTGDMEAAIAEGSTMVRIGTAIFGQRPD